MKGIQTIMRAFVVAAISMWVIILEPTFAASDLSFDASSPTTTTYSKLLSDLREWLTDPNLHYGGTNVPVMAATFKKIKYFLVDIKGSEGGTITIALDLYNDIYVVGYLDKINEKLFRSHIFKDFVDKTNDLFPEAKGIKNRLPINYKSSYGDIEHNAEIKRRSLGLGADALNKYINKVYGKALDVKTEARFLLVVIQMISETTRFKYIENMIVENIAASYNPDPKATELEINWSKISEGIKESKKGVISPELDLMDVNGKEWKVSKVEDIVNDMALLNFFGKSQVSVFNKLKLFMNKCFVTKTGDDEAEL